MTQGGKRKWLIRSGALVVVLALGCWAATNSSFFQTQYAAYQLRSATTDEQRTQAANQLVSLGTPGLTKLIEFVQSGNAPCRNTATNALDKFFGNMPGGDTRAIPVAGQILDIFPKTDDAGKEAVLELISNIL